MGGRGRRRERGTGREPGKGREEESPASLLGHLRVVRLILKAVGAAGGSGGQEGCDPVRVSSGCLERTENSRRGLGAREPLEARGLTGDSPRAAPVVAEVGRGGAGVSRELRGLEADCRP